MEWFPFIDGEKSSAFKSLDDRFHLAVRDVALVVSPHRLPHLRQWHGNLDEPAVSTGERLCLDEVEKHLTNVLSPLLSVGFLMGHQPIQNLAIQHLGGDLCGVSFRYVIEN